jgi:tetratricopeptide (TPR) repeat protein
VTRGRSHFLVGLLSLASLAMLLSSVACQREEVTLDSIGLMLGAGQVEEALETIREELDRDPDRYDLQLAYGRVLVLRGEHNLAIWPLREAARDPEFEVPALLMLAQSQVAIGNGEEALRAINLVLESDPDNREALIMRIEAHLEAMALEDALLDSEHLLDLFPDDSRILLARARALLLLERAEEAETALDELHVLIEEDPEAHPEETQARVCAARAHFQLEKGNLETAFEQASECADRFPASHVALQEILDAHVRRDEVEEAFARIRASLAANPMDSQIRYLLAEQLRFRGESEEAEQVLKDGLALFDPPRSQDWRLLYEHYWQMKDFPQSLDAFEKTLELVPMPSTGDLMQLADAHTEAGNLDRAEEVAERLSEGYRELILGRILYERGEYEKARETLLIGIRQWPSNPVARMLLGEISARLGDLETALSEYTEAYRIDYGHNAPDERTDSAKEVARFHMALGAYGNAIGFLNSHLGVKPTDIEGLELLARAAARGGKPELGNAALNLLTQTPGGFARAVAVQSKLVSEVKGPAAAIEAISKGKTDLTDASSTRVLDVYLRELALLGRHEAATKYAATAVRANSGSGVHIALLARARMGAGHDPAEIQKQIDIAREREPDHIGVLMIAGQFEAEQGRIAEAIELYDRAAGGSPDSPAAALEAARLVALDPGKREEALERLETILSDHPLESRAATALAKLIVESQPDGQPNPQELEQALRYAERAAHYGGSLPVVDAAESFVVLGRVQQARGDQEAAQAAFDFALKIDGENEAAREMLREADAATPGKG